MTLFAILFSVFFLTALLSVVLGAFWLLGVGPGLAFALIAAVIVWYIRRPAAPLGYRVRWRGREIIKEPADRDQEQSN